VVIRANAYGAGLAVVRLEQALSRQPSDFRRVSPLSVPIAIPIAASQAFRFILLHIPVPPFLIKFYSLYSVYSFRILKHNPRCTYTYFIIYHSILMKNK
jgi:hypothetical protein